MKRPVFLVCPLYPSTPSNVTEAALSFRRFVPSYQNARRHVPQDSNSLYKKVPQIFDGRTQKISKGRNMSILKVLVYCLGTFN